MNKKVVKKIITVIAVSSTCTLIGCSQNVNSNYSSLPNSEPAVQNSEASSQESATAASETATSAEIQTDTSTEESVDKNNSDKQQMIDCKRWKNCLSFFIGNIMVHSLAILN